LIHGMKVPEGASENGAFWTWMGEDGIARTTTKPHADVTREDALRNRATISGYLAARGRRFPLLVDSSPTRSLSREARRILTADDDPDLPLNAYAIVVGSPLTRAIANFFVAINRQTVPTRVFDDVDAALAWLKPFA
jgi:hypothetical protein